MREICISATVNLQKGMIGNRKIESLDACLGFFFSLSCSQASTFLLVSFFFSFLLSAHAGRKETSSLNITSSLRFACLKRLKNLQGTQLSYLLVRLSISVSPALFLSTICLFFVVCLFPRVATDTFFAACTTAPELQSSAVLLFFFFFFRS